MTLPNFLLNSSRYTPEKIHAFLTSKKERFWLRKMEERALSLFHAVAVRVPAYKDFLRRNKIDSGKIKNFQDFQLVPPINKKEYLRAYPLKDLLWDGTLQNQFVFSATSGSTGEPFYFPRNYELDWESSLVHEMFLRNSSHGVIRPTLVLICFGMGVWIGSMITYQAFKLLSERGYPLSILTPGVNKQGILNVLKNLATHFPETVLVGYPPFIKDIIDEAGENGINLKQLNLRILCAAEPFSEKFRDYIAKHTFIKNVYKDTLNIYGTADIGTMAFETPTAILVRRIAMKNKKVFHALFPSLNKTPTLAQYNPLLVVFEALRDEILVTGNNAMPLVRYALGDRGGILQFSDIVSKLKIFDIDFQKEASTADIGHLIYQMPFVYVYERDDFSTTLYGLQIYPEMLREIFFDEDISKVVTGKFAMLTKFDKDQNQYLEINLEMRKNKRPSSRLKKILQGCIISELQKRSSEFHELYLHLGERVAIKIVFWPTEHPRYFKIGSKQKWVIK